MIVGICGGTGSGKTTIARKILESVGKDKVVLIEQDSYYIDLAEIPLDERRKVNFDHPSSIDIDLIAKHIIELRDGRSIEQPIYDFAFHTRQSTFETVEPKQVIIVEGILIFSQTPILDLLDLKVYVDTPADIRLLRRIRRDIEERGRTLDQTLSQYENTIRPMHLKYVEPFKDSADIIIPDGESRADSINVLCEMILKSTAERAIHTTQ